MKVVQLPNKKAAKELNLRETFLLDLKHSGKSHHTISSYNYDLNQFQSLIGVSWEKVTVEHIRDYFEKLSGNSSQATLARKHACLKSFFSWSIRNEYLEKNPMDKLEQIKIPDREPRPLNDNILIQILNAIPKESIRDRLLFTLIRETGLRVSEALNIYIEDLSLDSGDEKIIIRNGKGGKSRTVMLYSAPDSLKLLKRYLNKTGLTSGALFRARESRGGTNTPMQYRSLYYLWRRYCKLSGIIKPEDTIYPSIHALRHAYASELIKDGIDVAVISKLLGHKHLQTTMMYSEITERQIKEELIKKGRKKSRF